MTTKAAFLRDNGVREVKRTAVIGFAFGDQFFTRVIAEVVDDVCFIN